MIPRDYSRCLDQDCPSRLHCERYKPDGKGDYSFVATLRTTPEDPVCTFIIAKE